MLVEGGNTVIQVEVIQRDLRIDLRKEIPVNHREVENSIFNNYPNGKFFLDSTVVVYQLLIVLVVGIN